MPDLTETIETVAQEPAAAEVDGVSASHHRLPDLIAADKYVKQSDAATQANVGIRFRTFVSPGPAGSGRF